MAAIDDLTQLVERAAAAEKTVLTSKWKNEPDVQAFIRKTREVAEEQRQEVSLDTDPDRLSPRWASLQQCYTSADTARPSRTASPWRSNTGSPGSRGRP